MKRVSLLIAMFLLFSCAFGLFAASGSSPLFGTFQDSGQTSQQAPSPSPKPRSRMEDHGCCVLKKSKYKPEWDFKDDEVRKLCVETARKSGFDYDFYKDQSCDDVKKQGN
jgi:hypothetical protein